VLANGREPESDRGAWTLQAFEALGSRIEDHVELVQVDPAAYRVHFENGGHLDLLNDVDAMQRQMEAVEPGAGESAQEDKNILQGNTLFLFPRRRRPPGPAEWRRRHAAADGGLSQAQVGSHAVIQYRRTLDHVRSRLLPRRGLLSNGDKVSHTTPRAHAPARLVVSTS